MKSSASESSGVRLGDKRTRGATVAMGALLALLSGCHRKHVPVTSVPELGYPTCGGQPLPAGEVVASGDLRSSEMSVEQNVVEHFEVRQRGCDYVATLHQEWPLAIADVEVVYDANRVPLRAWRRTTTPYVPQGRASGADIRRYELRTPEITVKRRGDDGRVSYEILRGGIPRVVLGPGRGLLTMWIQRAHLAVGQRTRELVLDIRPQLEEVRMVSLIREPDLFQPWLGRTVRVYRVYGRESVFTDEHDVVIGDLAGLRPDAHAGVPRPAPLPQREGPPDPVATP